jgi:SAM-dependent methyltransferase
MKKQIKYLAQKLLLVYISFLRSRDWFPIRGNMGNGIGKSMSRYYVEEFIQSNRNEISGDIIEIGRNIYRSVIPQENINTYRCLDLEEFPDVDIVADIQHMPQVQDKSFDTIICTQVLEHVPNPFLAINEIYRVLKPGGTLFLTVPFLNNLHMEPHDYWRFTEYSICVLLNSFADTKIINYGSTYYYILATMGLSSLEVDMSLRTADSEREFPIIISAVAKK